MAMNESSERFPEPGAGASSTSGSGGHPSDHDAEPTTGPIPVQSGGQSGTAQSGTAQSGGQPGTGQSGESGVWWHQQPTQPQPTQSGGWPASSYPPYSSGSNNPWSQPQHGGGSAYGTPLGTTALAERPRKSGRGKIAAGALALVLAAGGVGGGVATVLNSGNGNPVVSSLSQTASGQSVAKAPDGSVQQVAARVLPSVVQIQVVVGGQGGEGSGVILSSDGLILTNNHVVQAAAGARSGAIMVAFNDGSTATATIVGRDPSSDIAVIKVAGKTGLTPIALGSSSSLAVGQNVVAIGSPLGLAGTVTSGIVSSLNRPVRASGDTTSAGQSSVLDAIQTDAAINPGNSGGALVNMNGELIGINSAIASLGASSPGSQSGSIGLGFAIPIDQARRVAQELIKNGVATQAVLGISVTNTPAGTRGATVGDVTPQGAAGKAGITTGSVITKIDNRIIEGGDSLVAAVRSHAPGDKVTLAITDQGGATKTVEVTLGSQTVGGR